MKKIFILGTILFVTCLSANAQGVKIPKVTLETAVKGGNVLPKLDSWYNSGKLLRSLNRSYSEMYIRTEALKSKVSTGRILRSELEAKSLYALPTEEKFLIMGLRLPDRMQKEEAFEKYNKSFEFFADIRRRVENQIIYMGTGKPFQEMAIPERTALIGDIFILGSRVENLLAVYFPNDRGLVAVLDYLNTVMKLVNPYHQTFARHPRSDERKYVKNEFFLKRPKDPRNSTKDVAYHNTLPENIRLAVLNDDEGILWTYRSWYRRGFFPKGWTLDVYEETSCLLDAVKNGTEFDLIITDKVVYGGGGDYLVDQLRRMKVDATIIGNSNFLPEHLDGKQMFQLGYDGYFSVREIFDNLDGYSDWYYQLQTYYHFKELHNWSR